VWITDAVWRCRNSKDARLTPSTDMPFLAI
jgi:hypothetical protein